MRDRNHHAGCCGLNPTRPDGSEWQHVLALRDGSVVHADSAAEIIDELIPGYELLDDEGRRAARIEHAHRLALAAQEARIATETATGTLDPSDPGVAPLLSLLRAPRSEALAFETEDAPGVPAPWLGAPQLVLVTTTYEPHGTTPPVTGNVAWLDPDTEAGYLASLGEAGVFSYWANASG